MTAEVRVLESIPPEHAKRVGSLLRECFPPARWTSPRRQEHADRFCSQGDAWRHVLALEPAGTVVGFATVYRRSIAWQERAAMSLGGLGDVCTDPAWRRQGIATAVARAGMAELERVGCDVAYLCTAVRDPGMLHLYGQVGFVPLGRPYTYTGRSGRVYTDDDAMLAPVADPAAFQDMLTSSETLHLGRGNW